MMAKDLMWEPLSRHSSSCLELSLCSLVLDSFLKDLLTVIMACILIIIIWLVSVDRP